MEVGGTEDEKFGLGFCQTRHGYYEEDGGDE